MPGSQTEGSRGKSGLYDNVELGGFWSNVWVHESQEWQFHRPFPPSLSPISVCLSVSFQAHSLTHSSHSGNTSPYLKHRPSLFLGYCLLVPRSHGGQWRQAGVCTHNPCSFVSWSPLEGQQNRPTGQGPDLPLALPPRLRWNSEDSASSLPRCPHTHILGRTPRLAALASLSPNTPRDN